MTKNSAITLFVFISFLFTFSSLSAQSNNFGDLLVTLQDKNSTTILYTVQVGAFKNHNNPKAKHFDSLSDMFSKSYDDGYYRFYSTLYNNLTDAINYCSTIRENGFKDAFVIGIDGGFDRILLDLD